MALLVSSVYPVGLGGSVGLVDGLGQPIGELLGDLAGLATEVMAR